MKQDNIVVRSNPSLAFMLIPSACNQMNAIFLQIGKLCQEERMDTIIFFDIYFSNDISQITKVLSCIYATNENCGTFLLFEIVQANQFPDEEVKDDCLKLDWFSSETEKPENMSSHSKSYPYQDNRPTGQILGFLLR